MREFRHLRLSALSADNEQLTRSLTRCTCIFIIGGSIGGVWRGFLRWRPSSFSEWHEYQRRKTDSPNHTFTAGAVWACGSLGVPPSRPHKCGTPNQIRAAWPRPRKRGTTNQSDPAQRRHCLRRPTSLSTRAREGMPWRSFITNRRARLASIC